MRLFILMLSLVMIGCVNAEAPYKFMSEKNAVGYTGEVIMQSVKSWRYVGSIKNGKPHGHGVKILESGMVIYGEWVEGELNGNGAMYTPAPFGGLTAGSYKQNEVVGDAVLIIEGEAIEDPFGKFGVPHGKAMCAKEGVKKACEFNHGEKI